jgi:hypothetical protein
MDGLDSDAELGGNAFRGLALDFEHIEGLVMFRWYLASNDL